MKFLGLDLQLKVISLLAFSFFWGCSSSEDEIKDPYQQDEESLQQESSQEVTEQAEATEEGDLASIISDLNQQPGQLQNNNAVNQGNFSGFQQQSFQQTGQGGVVAGAAGNAATEGLPEMGSKMNYIVVQGDTLGGISRKIYGTTKHWRELAEASSLSNPHRIFPGDVIYYQLSEQSLAFAKDYSQSPRGEIIVEQGDTLVSISKKLYGSRASWKNVWRLNDKISNPDLITPGTVLVFALKGVRTAYLESIKIEGVQKGFSHKVVKNPKMKNKIQKSFG